MSQRKIAIKCTGSALLDIDKLTEFQGKLKTRTEADIEAVARSIEQFGFSFPFFVWHHGKQNHCLDGHGRLIALRLMRENGWTVPPLPVAYIKAATSEEAKQKLLRMNSTYGTITETGLLEFTSDVVVEWSELSLPAGVITFGEDADAGADDLYTRKVETPIYKPTGEQPRLGDLVNTEKTDELLARIEKSKLDAGKKRFLQLAAQRHIVFDYGKIAEYYAHADKATQRLMENSALVIIDFDKAIEGGFVRLSSEIKRAYLQDYPND